MGETSENKWKTDSEDWKSPKMDFYNFGKRRFTDVFEINANLLMTILGSQNTSNGFALHHPSCVYFLIVIRGKEF